MRFKTADLGGENAQISLDGYNITAKSLTLSAVSAKKMAAGAGPGIIEEPVWTSRLLQIPIVLRRPGSKVTVRIFTINGACVKTVFRGICGTGGASVKVEAGDLPWGPFVLKVETEEHTIVRLLTAIR